MLRCAGPILRRRGKSCLARDLSITHITDIEGNGVKFYKIIDISSHIRVGGPKTGRRLHFRNSDSDSQFVYGGDVGDKGPFSMRLLETLVDFKEREPSRVHLIVGNREAKMVRIFNEITDDGMMRDRLLHAPAVFWNHENPPEIFVSGAITKLGLKISPEEYVCSLSETQCKVLYLKWMLSETMGCGRLKPSRPLDTFDLFRRELSEITGVSEEEVQDEKVLEWLLREVSDGGLYRRYLSQGVLMHRIEDTLFLHGAVTNQNLGYVPDNSELQAENIDNWISGLNLWFQNEISEWSRGLHKLKSFESTPGAGKLMWYLVQNPLSVVTTNWYGIEKKVAPLNQGVVDYLNRNGIRRVVSGHQPFSDFPLVLRHNHQLQVIVGDTSYSDSSHPDNNQGIAYHSLEIYHNEAHSDSFAVITAVRRNGKKQKVDLSDPQMDVLGRISADGVQRLNEDGIWVTSQLKGFTIIDTPILN